MNKEEITKINNSVVDKIHKSIKDFLVTSELLIGLDVVIINKHFNGQPCGCSKPSLVGKKGRIERVVFDNNETLLWLDTFKPGMTFIPLCYVEITGRS